MNRREALRSLAGGMAAGALAAASVAVVVPADAAQGIPVLSDPVSVWIEKFRRLDVDMQDAIYAVLDAYEKGEDPTPAIYAALGEERGAAFIAIWRRAERRATR